MRAKFKGHGKPYGKEEFDKIFGDYDVSCASFVSIIFLLYRPYFARGSFLTIK